MGENTRQQADEQHVSDANTHKQAEMMSARRKLPRISKWWNGLKRWEKITSIVLAVIFLFLFYVALDANKYQAAVRVVDGEGRVGVNPTTERLDFGDLSQGSSAVRTVKVENGTFMPMFVSIFKFGSISDLVKINKNHFKLSPNTEKEIEFLTYIPASAEIGADYTGRIILFKIPTFGL